MDVERIQKINNLALDLVKQGLAVDREEAIAQAENIYKGQQSQEFSSMRETLQEVKSDQEAKIEPKSVDSHEDGLSQDKIKEILERNTKYVVKMMREFQEKIASMEREMDALRTRMKYKELPTVKDVVSSSSQTPKNEEDTEKKESEPHPRSGNFGDEDVSIEKFFYMGSK